MKRVVFLVTLALTCCLAASEGFCQGWMPGPPPTPMPYGGAAMPMGQPGLMPGLNPSCGPMCPPMPQCGPLPCGPSRPASIAGLVGWQFGNDPGGIKFSTRGHQVTDKTGTWLEYDLSGLWAGVSARVQPSDSVSLRGEWRHFFPSEERCQEISMYATLGGPVHRVFTRSKYRWNVLDGSVGMNVACGVSLLGGLRWDALGVSLGHAPVIASLSSAADEGDLTISALIPYGGGEFAWSGCEWGVLMRVIGTPWISASTRYGLTYGNGGDPSRGPIRDHMYVNSKYGSFVEASLLLGKKLSNEFSASVFGMITSLSVHSQGSMKSTLLAGTTHAFESSQSHFDVDLTRWTVVLGGNVAVGFNSPL